jgi:aminoglycoside phosphotransferase family enzyme
VSPATKVIFTRTMFTSRPLCLKMWLPCNNGIYNTEDEPSRWEYLLKGLEYNRRFARKIYLGIAPVEQESKDTIRRGRLIKHPQKSELKPGVQYALVMQCLDESWRLDHLLFEGKLNTKSGIEFLAKEVANMHDQLMLSPEGRGNPESISSKLAFNRRFFDEALKLLAYGDESVNKFKCIDRLMIQFCGDYSEHFGQRYRNGHIKHCHGDLKAANLWVRPEKLLFWGLKKYHPQLLALDCVDFRPEFCHIDTLSDVAMLAIDIEMQLTDWSDENMSRLSGQSMARSFLQTYLREVQEDDKAVWPLLEYYMTEKSMVSASMNILYSGSSVLGKRYLDIALSHAEKLQKLLACSGKLLAA